MMLLDGVERNAFRILLGQDARSMDVLYRINPLWATRVIQKRMRHLLS